jgi:hypothetical protein
MIPPILAIEDQHRNRSAWVGPAPGRRQSVIKPEPSLIDFERIRGDMLYYKKGLQRSASGVDLRA